MTARAVWKGVLVLGDERVPVKLYAAIGAVRVDFRLLHAVDRVPVAQQLVDDAGEPVARDQVGRALEIEPGVFAALSAEDLAEVEPPASREIELTRFVPVGQIDGRWTDRPYWLGPDGDEAGYGALVAALSASGREGVARWVMRDRANQGVLRVNGSHLMLVRLRHPEEVLPRAAVTAPEGRAADDRELALAQQLVRALEGPFDPDAFPETFTDRVRELVDARIAGKELELQAPPARKPATDGLHDALTRSLKAAGGARG